MADPQFDTWTALLAKQNPPLHETEPASGFYRLRNGVDMQPVAIWRDENGDLQVLRSGAVVDVGSVWPRAAKNPVSYEAYQQAIETGTWPDDAPTRPALSDAAENPRAVPGNNLSTGDAALDLKNELAGEQELASTFLRNPVTSQEEADQIGVWTKRLRDLKNRADAAHKQEKEPHLTAGKAVDDRFRFRDNIDALIKKLTGHLTPWLQAQQDAQRAAARAAAEEAERLQREAAQAADPEQAAAVQAKADAAAKSARVTNASAGRTGAKVSLRTVREPTLTDPAACFAFYAKMQTLPDELHEALLKVARRSISGGVTPPGITIVEKQVAA